MTRNSFHPSQRSSFTSHLRLFSNKEVISPGADNRFLVQFASGAVLLLSLRRSGSSQRRHPAKKRRDERGYNPVFLFCSHAHLLPLTPPGTRSDLCRDLASLFTLTHAFPLCSEGKPHQIPCALQELSGGPVAAQPRLDCRDCCLAAPPSCGVGSDSLSMAAEIAVVVSLNICFLC